MNTTLSVETGSKTQLIEITHHVEDQIRSAGIDHGLCFLFVPHTTAAITINENADPSVKSDIRMILDSVIPWEAPYEHLEGNSPAHIKATLVGASEIVAVEKARLVLGRWQGIFFCEFDGPRQRKVHLRVV